MMHTVPKVSSKNMVKAQTFGTFPRFFEKILVFALFALSLAVELIDRQVAFEKAIVAWAKATEVATTKPFRDRNCSRLF
jgi:hypothetical protein